MDARKKEIISNIEKQENLQIMAEFNFVNSDKEMNFPSWKCLQVDSRSMLGTWRIEGKGIVVI